jgi:hypothetical protein
MICRWMSLRSRADSNLGLFPVTIAAGWTLPQNTVEVAITEWRSIASRVVILRQS